MPVVLITGCSSGFGRAAALAFARAGYTVHASMRDLSRGESLRTIATQERLDVQLVALDVTQPAQFGPVVEAIVARSGRLDVLVNNAGILHPGAFEDLTESQFRAVMETNAIAPLLLARAVLPQMRRQAGGLIINISSLSGVAGLPGDVAYTASKFAIEGATEALRHEVDRWNIRVALVEAGLYATGIFAPGMSEESVLPRGYPMDSPYRVLVEHKLQELRKRMPEAFDPATVGELLVRIAKSDTRQLRWPADGVATRVLGTLFAHDDAGRDQFLRNVSGTEWWSQGAERPG